REEESSCLDCGYPGVIKFQPTEVPFFRNIVVMPFSCLNCRFESTEIQPEPTQDRGTKCVFRIETIVDLERRVFKSESCVCLFQELEIEIPARRSQVSTIASILRQIIYDLSADQPSRLNFD
ncbi:zf-ZPR1-domain-containing protein, partial [Nadsonia fulvescens var. elongata DSM 6958]